MNLLDTITKLDLSPSEAKTYLAILNAGKLKASQIAQTTGLTRTASYNAIYSLSDKGLISEVTQENIKYVTAESPENLQKRIENMKQQVNDKEKALSEIMPELKQLYSSIDIKPSVRVYSGLEGLKSVYEDTLKTMKPNDSYVAYGSVEKAFGALKVYLNKYVRRRVKKNISFRGIAPSDPQAIEFTQEDKNMLREVRLIPKDKFPFKNEINIYSDKVAIISFDDKIGLIIKSKQIADTQRSIFELSWLGAKEANARNN